MGRFLKAGCIAFLALFLCSASYALSLPQSIQIADQEQVRLVPDMVRYWPESEHESFDSPALLPQEGWHAIDRASINVGKSSHPVWIRFDVDNSGKEAIKRFLEIRWINLNLVEFFAVDTETGEITKIEAGLQRPKSSADFSNTSWLFPIELDADET